MINTKSIKAALCDLYMNALAEQNTVVGCSKGAFFPNRLNINWAFHRLPLGRSRWRGNHELVVFSKSRNLELGVHFVNRKRANKSSRR